MSKLKEIFTWMVNSEHPCVIICLMIFLMSGAVTVVLLVAAYPEVVLVAIPIGVIFSFICAVRKYLQDHK